MFWRATVGNFTQISAVYYFAVFVTVVKISVQCKICGMFCIAEKVICYGIKIRITGYENIAFFNLNFFTRGNAYSYSV